MKWCSLDIIGQLIGRMGVGDKKDGSRCEDMENVNENCSNNSYPRPKSLNTFLTVRLGHKGQGKFNDCPTEGDFEKSSLLKRGVTFSVA